MLSGQRKAIFQCSCQIQLWPYNRILYFSRSKDPAGKPLNGGLKPICAMAKCILSGAEAHSQPSQSIKWFPFTHQHSGKRNLMFSMLPNVLSRRKKLCLRLALLNLPLTSSCNFLCFPPGGAVVSLGTIKTYAGVVRILDCSFGGMQRHSVQLQLNLLFHTAQAKMTR